MENRRPNTTNRIRNIRVVDIVSESNQRHQKENPNISKEVEEVDDDVEQSRIDPEQENVEESPRIADDTFIGRRIEEIKALGYTINNIQWAKQNHICGITYPIIINFFLIFLSIMTIFFLNNPNEKGLFCINENILTKNLTFNNNTRTNQTYDCIEICTKYNSSLIALTDKLYKNSFRLFMIIDPSLQFLYAIKNKLNFYLFNICIFLGNIGIVLLELIIEFKDSILILSTAIIILTPFIMFIFKERNFLFFVMI